MKKSLTLQKVLATFYFSPTPIFNLITNKGYKTMKIVHNHLPTNLMILALLTFSIFLLSPIQSHARDASFAWTANPDPLIGYKLYYKTGTNSSAPYNGTGLNEGGSPILLGKISSTVVTGLSPDETYQFTLTAYNDTGESGYSTIVPVLPISFPSPTINSMSHN